MGTMNPRARGDASLRGTLGQAQDDREQIRRLLSQQQKPEPATGGGVTGFTRAKANNATFGPTEVGFTDWTFDTEWNATVELNATAPALQTVDNASATSHVFGAVSAGFYIAKYSMSFQISSTPVPSAIYVQMNFGSTTPGSSNPLTKANVRPDADGKTFRIDAWTGPFYVPAVGSSNTGAFGLDAGWPSLGATPTVAWWGLSVDIAQMG